MTLHDIRNKGGKVYTTVRRQRQVKCLKVSKPDALPRQTAFHKREKGEVKFTEYKKS